MGGATFTAWLVCFTLCVDSVLRSRLYTYIAAVRGNRSLYPSGQGVRKVAFRACKFLRRYCVF